VGKEGQITQEEAFESIKANAENENLIKHMLATEAIMRALAKRLGEDEEQWGLTNLGIEPLCYPKLLPRLS